MAHVRCYLARFVFAAGHRSLSEVAGGRGRWEKLAGRCSRSRKKREESQMRERKRKKMKINSGGGSFDTTGNDERATLPYVAADQNGMWSYALIKSKCIRVGDRK